MSGRTLRPAPSPNAYEFARPDRPEEFVCDLCGCRCTRGPSGTEYGHRRRGTERGNGQKTDAEGGRCPRRPNSVDPVRGVGT